MAFFLFAVSGLLIFGGFALALYGADTIRSESGAMFAATGLGTVAAGLLLLGVTRIFVEVRRIRIAMEDGLALMAGGAAVAVVPPAAAPEPGPAVESGHGQAAVLAENAQRELDLGPPAPGVPAAGAMAASAAAAAGAAVAGGLADQLLQRTRRKMEDDEREAPGDEPTDEREAASIPAEGPEGAEPPPPAAAAPAQVDDDDDDLLRDVEAVMAPPPPAAPAPEPATPAFADMLDQTLGETPAAAETAPGGPPAAGEALPSPPGERTLAATYTSGENTYFMYADGTIEAETPIGRFRFFSMDELRNFVETGEGGIPLSPPAPPGAA